MILERCTDQKPNTLDAFYAEIASAEDPISRSGGLAMLDLLAALRGYPNPRQMWGLTSHYRLCLLAQNTYIAPWYVIIAALDHRNFSIEYLMPEKNAPWAGAYVKGEAQSLEAAVAMVLIAMDRSEGWLATQ